MTKKKESPEEIVSKISGTLGVQKVDKRFRSPRSDADFSKVWNKLIHEITTRENFKPGHLHQLEVLCDLYVEYDRLRLDVKRLGYTYETGEGRNGVQIKIRPEVTQINRCRSEIRSYSKTLGLLLVKDTDFNTGEEEDEWD
jgi:phage terminase small subunit